MATAKEGRAAGPTRRPWEIYDFDGVVKDYPKTIIVAPTGESICEISGGWPQCTLAENEANAALIVRAVNNHDALVEALSTALCPVCKYSVGFRPQLTEVSAEWPNCDGCRDTRAMLAATQE